MTRLREKKKRRRKRRITSCLWANVVSLTVKGCHDVGSEHWWVRARLWDARALWQSCNGEMRCKHYDDKSCWLNYNIYLTSNLEIGAALASLQLTSVEKCFQQQGLWVEPPSWDEVRARSASLPSLTSTHHHPARVPSLLASLCDYRAVCTSYA